MSESFFQAGIGAGGATVSFNDTGEKTSWTTTGAGKETDGESEIDSDAVTGLYGEKEGTD